MSENFDLLGDPIPNGHGGRGRPQHIPTAQNRNRVMMLLAFGWTDRRIASALGITEPTFRKHYFRERKVRDSARDRLEANHLAMVWEQAKIGNVSAMKEFRKLMDKHDLHLIEREFDKPTIEKLGKKELAALAAETAGVDSEWGDDLLPPDTRPH